MQCYVCISPLYTKHPPIHTGRVECKKRTDTYEYWTTFQKAKKHWRTLLWKTASQNSWPKIRKNLHRCKAKLHSISYTPVVRRAHILPTHAHRKTRQKKNKKRAHAILNTQYTVRKLVARKSTGVSESEKLIFLAIASCTNIHHRYATYAYKYMNQAEAKTKGTLHTPFVPRFKQPHHRCCYSSTSYGSNIRGDYTCTCSFARQATQTGQNRTSSAQVLSIHRACFVGRGPSLVETTSKSSDTLPRASGEGLALPRTPNTGFPSQLALVSATTHYMPCQA